jgi:pyruvate dehydrogenase (quinone)/pyruvate oxidase
MVSLALGSSAADFGTMVSPYLAARERGAIGAVVGRAYEEARRPVIVEGVVDPFEPPLPAKITAEQALHFATSLVRGEPNRAKIALTVLADKVRELV